MIRRFLPLIALLLVACAPVIHPLEPSPAPTRTKATATASPAPLATSTLITARVIADESLNVRQLPSETKPVLGYLYHGNRVTILGCSKNPKGWAQIVWKSGRAWVRAKYLSDNKCEE